MDLSHLSQWLVVIPARLDSQRLPNKPLADLGGKPMIVRVAENLAPLKQAGAEVVVATDSEKILEACAKHHVCAEMTAANHQSGTDRCFEVAARRSQPFILNVQGDEPFLSMDDVLSLLESFSKSPHFFMGTLAFLSHDQAAFKNPNVVKIARAHSGHALYFSRSPIPCKRDRSDHAPESFWHHMGVYTFQRQALAAFCKLPPSPLEQVEKLEQLRALEQNWDILVQPAKSLSFGIDTLADLEVARARLFSS